MKSGKDISGNDKGPGEEILPVVNRSGEYIGKATREECHSNPELLHPVVHLHLFRPDGRMYLQQRAMTKDLFPGYWDTAVGGHISVGESVTEALLREGEEELGIHAAGADFLFHYIWNNKNETEYVHSFTLVYTGEVCYRTDELMGGAFFTFAEIGKMIAAQKTTPNFAYEFGLLQKKGYFHHQPGDKLK
jgi:isopentenyldiphosphate isomerase